METIIDDQLQRISEIEEDFYCIGFHIHGIRNSEINFCLLLFFLIITASFFKDTVFNGLGS